MSTEEKSLIQQDGVISVNSLEQANKEKSFKYTKKEKINRFCFFGVFLSFIPVIIAVIFDLAVRYTFSQAITRHYIDFLLVIFAVAVNVYSSITNLEIKIDEYIRRKYENPILAMGVFTFIFYVGLYVLNMSAEVFAPDDMIVSYAPGIMIGLRVLSVPVFIIIIKRGIDFEKFLYDSTN